jgi:hypothetical protein
VRFRDTGEVPVGVCEGQGKIENYKQTKVRAEAPKKMSKACVRGGYRCDLVKLDEVRSF